jgi:hypothetical protein
MSGRNSREILKVLAEDESFVVGIIEKPFKLDEMAELITPWLSRQEG